MLWQSTVNAGAHCCRMLMLSIRYFQKRIRQICESKICSSILNAKIPLLWFFFLGHGCLGAWSVWHNSYWHCCCTILWLTRYGFFWWRISTWRQRGTPLSGETTQFLLPVPCVTRGIPGIHNCSVSSVLQAAVMAQKGRLLGGPSCWMWKLPVEASLSQLSFPVQRTWGMETAAGGRSVPFPSNMVCFLTVRLLHLHWRLAQPAWAVSAGCMDMSPNKYTRALRMKIQERSLGQASKMVKYVSVQFRAGLGACSESQEASQSTNQALGPPGQDTVGY